LVQWVCAQAGKRRATEAAGERGESLSARMHQACRASAAETDCTPTLGTPKWWAAAWEPAIAAATASPRSTASPASASAAADSAAPAAASPRLASSAPPRRARPRASATAGVPPATPPAAACASRSPRTPSDSPGTRGARASSHARPAETAGRSRSGGARGWRGRCRTSQTSAGQTRQPGRERKARLGSAVAAQ
jgi:hypothetical protein